MRATFEEKTYENYFNSELARQTDIYFPLGQVQEGSLGFDSSALSSNRRLWRRLGHPFWFFPPFAGIELREIAGEMEHFLGVTLDNIPRMKATLLFQYKKPEYITIPRGSEWTHWNEPYYRYDIYQEQQNLLIHIDNQFGSKIFIVYASPALHDVNDLVTAHLNRQIVNVSNFRKVSELSRHHRNTYTQAGRHSIACSEPEKIENFDVIKTIESLNTESNKADENNRAFILNFRKQLVSLMSENQFYSASFKKLNEQYSKIEKYELFYSHLVLNNFRMLTGTQWLVKL
jgi:hypothetical protein